MGHRFQDRKKRLPKGKMAELDEKEKRFVIEFSKDCNASRAAKASGIRNAGLALSNPLVLAAIEAECTKIREAKYLERDEILKQLAYMVHRDAGDLVNDQGYIRSNIKDLPESIRCCIDGIKQKKRTRHLLDGSEEVTLETEIKLTPKQGAVDLAMRHKGLFAPAEINVNRLSIEATAFLIGGSEDQPIDPLQKLLEQARNLPMAPSQVLEVTGTLVPPESIPVKPPEFIIDPTPTEPGEGEDEVLEETVAVSKPVPKSKAKSDKEKPATKPQTKTEKAKALAKSIQSLVASEPAPKAKGGPNPNYDPSKVPQPVLTVQKEGEHIDDLRSGKKFAKGPKKNVTQNTGITNHRYNMNKRVEMAKANTERAKERLDPALKKKRDEAARYKLDEFLEGEE